MTQSLVFPLQGPRCPLSSSGCPLALCDPRQVPLQLSQQEQISVACHQPAPGRVTHVHCPHRPLTLSFPALTNYPEPLFWLLFSCKGGWQPPPPVCLPEFEERGLFTNAASSPWLCGAQGPCPSPVPRARALLPRRPLPGNVFQTLLGDT